MDTDNKTATSVLERQSHTAGNEAIAEEEDEGTEAGASAGREAATTVAQSAPSDVVLLTYLLTVHTLHTWLLFDWPYLSTTACRFFLCWPCVAEVCNSHSLTPMLGLDFSYCQVVYMYVVGGQSVSLPVSWLT